MEIVNSITGETKIEGLGKIVSGRDSFTANVEINLESIAHKLKIIHQCYEDNLPEEFSWIENISKEKDPEIIEILDYLIDEKFEKKTN